MTPWTAACQASLSFTISWCLLKLISIELVIPSNHLVLYHSLLFLLSIFPSIRVFSNKSVLCIRWPKYWSFSVSISPPNEYSGLIFFRVYCFDLLAAQGILKSLHQHHSSKKKSSQSSQIDKVHKRDFLGKCQGGQKIIVIWEGELKGTQTPSLASSVC